MMASLSNQPATGTVAENIAQIRKNILAASQRVGRDSSRVRLIAATKTVQTPKLHQAYAAGIRTFGENRLQEAQEKMDQFGPREGLEWHFIGRMQRRKLKAIVGNFVLLHSVESVVQAQAINALAVDQGIQQPVLLEVNLAGESSKGGFSRDELKQSMPVLDQLSNVAIRGLMTLPPRTSKPEGARPFFAQLGELKDDLASAAWNRIHLEELSMGMSHDYEVAVEEGATMVRIGSAIFGPRS